MQILVVHDSNGVYDAFSGSGDEIIDNLKVSTYWSRIVERLGDVIDGLSEEEISLEMIPHHLHHDGDSEYGFTILTSKGKDMLHEEKVKYMTDALNLCQFGTKEEYTDLIVRVYDLVLQKEGATSLMDIVHVKQEHKKAFPDPKPIEDEKVCTTDEKTGSANRETDL